MAKYNKDAVNKEIKRDPRIKGKEAKAIHRLLKGESKIMFEFIVGLALLPLAIVVGIWLLGIGIAAIWILGGWVMALAGIILLVNGLAFALSAYLGLMWGGYSAAG